MLFVESKCNVAIHRRWTFKLFKMVERSDGYSGETLLALCTKKMRLQGKTYYRIDIQENLSMFSKS